MDESEINKLGENDIGDIFISSSIRDSVWYPMAQIRRALTLMHAPVVLRRNQSSRNKKEITDFVLPREEVLANTPAQHILQETR